MRFIVDSDNSINEKLLHMLCCKASNNALASVQEISDDMSGLFYEFSNSNTDIFYFTQLHKALVKCIADDHNAGGVDSITISHQQVIQEFANQLNTDPEYSDIHPFTEEFYLFITYIKDDYEAELWDLDGLFGEHEKYTMLFTEFSSSEWYNNDQPLDDAISDWMTHRNLVNEKTLTNWFRDNPHALVKRSNTIPKQAGSISNITAEDCWYVCVGINEDLSQKYVKVSEMIIKESK